MSKNSLIRSQFSYLISELLVLAWSASVQRANPYSDRITSTRRPSLVKKFRRSLLLFVEQELLPVYRLGCSEQQHLTNLQRLVAYGTEFGGALFDSNGYRIGVAQKFLNMLLKSLWSLGVIPEPPHCPVDRVIISKTNCKMLINWTEMTTLDE